MSPTELKPLSNLAKKIVAVMASAGLVKKDKRNDYHNYRYASDEAIVTALRAALIANNVAIIQSQKSCEEIKGEKMTLTKLCVQFELIDADSGESKTVEFFGYGSDSGDKGVYKAATGAEKYFLMKTFLIATPDDPEFEKNQAAARRAYSTPAQTSSTPKSATQPSATTGVTPPKTTHPTKDVTAFLSDITVGKATTGNPFYKLKGTEGESWTAFSETVAKSAKELMSKGVQMKITLEMAPRGPVAVAVVPA